MAEQTYYNQLYGALTPEEQYDYGGYKIARGLAGAEDANMMATGTDYQDIYAAEQAAEATKPNMWNPMNWLFTPAESAEATDEERAAIERDASLYQGEGTTRPYLGAKNPLQDYYEREYPTETTSPYLGSGSPIPSRRNVDRIRPDPAFGELFQKQRATTSYPGSFYRENYYDLWDEIPRLQQDDFYENFKNQQLAERGITAAVDPMDVYSGRADKNYPNVPKFTPSGLDIDMQYTTGDEFNLQDDEETLGTRFKNRLRGLPGIQFLKDKFRYKPAEYGVQGPRGPISMAQMNAMNARGGYYSEPARADRRRQKRQIDILNRAAAGKPVGNVNQLLGQHGYSSDGGGGIQFTGTPQGDPTAGAGYSRKDDSWSSSTFRHGGRVGYKTGGRVGILAAF